MKKSFMLKLLKLSPAEIVLLLSAYRWLFWARKELRGLRGKGWLIGEKERQSAEDTWRSKPTDDEIKDIVKAIDRAARTPFRWSKCLQSSLALRRWLSTKGVLAELHIGVKKEAQGIAAHAWLEYQNELLNDSVEATASFVALTRGVRGKNLAEFEGLAWD